MIYIKRFLYLLFVVVIVIIGIVTLFITVLTIPFISMVDYIVHGKLTKDCISVVYDLFDGALNKFKPE